MPASTPPAVAATPGERMAVLDRLILRMAVCELQRDPETPPPVVINEALELARLFAAVHASLAADGVFVFELNLPAAYEAWWTGEDEVTANGVRISRRHRRDPARGVIEAEVTIVDAAGHERRDRIVQRPYADAEVRRTAEHAGFAVRSCERYDPFGGGGAATKALWAVQRVRT